MDVNVTKKAGGINVNLTKGATKAELDNIHAQTLTAKTAAETAETNAETAETNSANSATSSANSATASANSATASASSASAAASSESGSEADRIAAAASAAAALTSENNAQSSEDDAAADLVLTHADVVLTHADVVLTHADVVLTHADTVATDADRTAVAADLVLTNQDTIDTAADLVATNQDTIDTAADLVLTNADVVLTHADVITAAGSASTATTQAGIATTKAGEASTSATSAAGSATTATTKAGEASSSATAAASSLTAVQTIEDNFDDRYLGSKASDPTLDNDGNALTDGALFFNTTSNLLNVYDLGSTTWLEILNLSLAALTDVTLTSIATGEIIKWNGTAFVNNTLAEAGIEPADSTIVKDADIGVTVQGYSAVLGATTASFLTADETKLDGIEASADVTDTVNVTASGALMDSEVTNLTQVKAFDTTDYATAAQGVVADNAINDAVAMAIALG